MTPIQKLLRWCRQTLAATRIADSERTMDDEIRFHLEMETAELQRSGVAAEEARRTALVTFGGVERFKQQARDERQLHLVEHFLRDTRLAVRQLQRSRGVALFSAALLAVGIGGTVVAFSVINTLYFRPLPYPNADRLVRVQSVLNDKQCGTRCGRSPNAREVDAMTRHATSVDAVGTIRISATTFRSSNGAMLLEGAAVNRDLVSMLRFRPLIGRGLTGADFAGDAPAVVALSYSGWQQQFGGDSSVVGRAITLDSASYLVVGVMSADAELGPPVFTFNVRRAQYLVPDRTAAAVQSFSSVIARLKSENALPAFRMELDRLIAAVSNDGPVSAAQGLHAGVTPLREVFIERYRASFWNLLGAAGAVLLVACLNVFGLYAARLHDRSQELATRVALGASRFRIAQQIAIETFVIALAGGAAGLVIGFVGTSMLNLLPVDNLPFWTRLQVDGRGLGLTAFLTCGIGVLLGAAAVAVLAPQQLLTAWRIGAAGGNHSGRVRQTLVASQIALTVTLLAVAVLLGNIVLQAELRDIGTARRGVMYVLLESPYTTRSDAGLAMSRRLSDQLMKIPGVAAVGVQGTSSEVIANTSSHERRTERNAPGDVPSIVLEGDASTALPGGLRLASNNVSTQYFDAIGTTILEGRAFTELDDFGAPPVVILDATTAQKLVRTGAIVGKRIGIAVPRGDRVWMTVVGVVSPRANNPLVQHERFEPQIYRPLSQVPSGPSFAAVKVSNGAYPTDRAVRAAVQEADPVIATARVLSVEESIGLRLSTARLSASLLVGSAIFATALCCLGIYAAISFVVSSRRREIAIRLALGAAHGEVVQLFMFAATRMVCAGLVLGVLGAVISTRFIKGMLYGADATNPAALAVALGFMLVSGVAAAWIPSRRATRLEPAQLLRSA